MRTLLLALTLLIGAVGIASAQPYYGHDHGYHRHCWPVYHHGYRHMVCR